ncbi:MAG: hypothetical protein HFACDABA_00968 [Anaerolineales bacterium]|nr:hypothetical protein [Anaerolineales bacterium]
MGLFDAPFIPGETPARDGPLARFLPPLEEGILAEWLPPQAGRGSWLLDPFGSAPRLDVEAARAGYRVLVTANNPITRFILELTAQPPKESELKAALADLAVTKKGGERLEDHLQSLYLTTCANCKKEIPARAFLWRKGETTPFARAYDCPRCKDSGEKPVTDADVKRYESVASTAELHRARLIERVAKLNDPDREYAEEALSVYTPRAVYALATLINRLDMPGVTAERRRVLSAMFLSTCDAANRLWGRGNERPRPKQLTVSNEYRENNIWMALEDSIAEWSAQAEPVPLMQWPNKLPESRGVLIYEGRIAELNTALKAEPPVAAVIGALPRFNQAFWTLSALWAGWLWGSESAEPFHVALRRRRYDWLWHFEALQAAIRSLFDLLALETPFFGFVPEPEPAFLTSALAAARSNHFELKSLAMRTAEDAAQIVWTRGERLHYGSEAENTDEILRAAMRDFLAARGEPVPYPHMHAAGLGALIQSHALAKEGQTSEEIVRGAASKIQQSLLDESAFTRYRFGEGAETGLWGLPRGVDVVEPLADRVEMAVVKFLLEHTDSRLPDILRHLAPGFPGLLTPSRGLVLAVLNSYAEENNQRWRIRVEDTPSARNAEIEQMANLLEGIGERLEFSANRLDPRTVIWEAGEASEYIFHLKASAIVGGKILKGQYPRERSLVVLPGGRAGLLAYKRQRDPAFAARLEGIRFVKFRLVRALAESTTWTRETFAARLESDPIEPARGKAG